MKKMIFFILSFILIFIKCDYDVNEAQITCSYKGWEKYHCIFYTRNSCCYVTTINCHYDDFFHRCEDSDANIYRKTNLENAIKKEHRLFDEENEEEEEENEFGVNEAQITCSKKGWKKYHCSFYTRNSCCYVTTINCHYDDFFHWCVDSDADLNRKTNLENLIKEEHRLFDEGNEEDEEYEDYDE